MTPAKRTRATPAAMKEWKTPGPLSKIRLSICAPAEQFCGNLVFFLRRVMGESFRRTSLPPSGCSRLFPELSWWYCDPSFRRLTAIFVWHTFSRSDLLWRWGRRAATSFNVDTHDPPRNAASVVAFRSGARKNEHITERGRGTHPPTGKRNPAGRPTATMSAPLPPYSTFRTDNKVSHAAAGPAGGIGSAGGRRKFRFPKRTVRPFSGGARKIWSGVVLRRRPSRPLLGPPTGGTRGPCHVWNCGPFRSAVSNFQLPLVSSVIPRRSPTERPPALLRTQTIAVPSMSIHNAHWTAL